MMVILDVWTKHTLVGIDQITLFVLRLTPTIAAKFPMIILPNKFSFLGFTPTTTAKVRTKRFAE